MALRLRKKQDKTPTKTGKQRALRKKRAAEITGKIIASYPPAAAVRGLAKVIKKKHNANKLIKQAKKYGVPVSPQDEREIMEDPEKYPETTAKITAAYTQNRSTRMQEEAEEEGIANPNEIDDYYYSDEEYDGEDEEGGYNFDGDDFDPVTMGTIETVGKTIFKGIAKQRSKKGKKTFGHVYDEKTDSVKKAPGKQTAVEEVIQKGTDEYVKQYKQREMDNYKQMLLPVGIGAGVIILIIVFVALSKK